MNFESKSSLTIMGEQDQSPESSCDDGNSDGQILENSPQKTEKIDRISELPDSLIVQILSRIPITDACRTTILSKRWENLWTSIDNVIYENEVKYNCSDSSTVHKFIFFTDNVLPLLSLSSIKKFSLDFAFDYDYGVSYSHKIDKWLEFALNKKVEDLYLNISYTDEPSKDDQPYSLSRVLCGNSSILKLDCRNCSISEDCVLNWTSLKSLTLGYLFLRDEHIEQIMSNCPQLESLKLCGFCGLNRLHISSPKCRQLQLIDHDHPVGDWGSVEGDCRFEIVAPYVQYLEISGDFNHMEIRLRDLSSLVHTDLTFCRDEYGVPDQTIVRDLFLGVRCANELMVSSWFIKVISDLLFEEDGVSLPLLECKCLTISSRITKFCFPGIDSLLRSTPYLENLMIYPDMPYCKCFLDEAVILSGLNYLSLQENIFKVFLQNLKNVKVISLFCSRYHRAELPQFLKFLLEHAMNLEKLVIAPGHKGCNICYANISKLIKNLLVFPRASNSAVLSLGSVVPEKILFSYI
ncbi:putative F-box protein At1g49610 [Lycium barbarum]|uniref:putative F-box protein At1g49610 n=1 Tax=Lycium barbarum TaxID=112863 RepID=UPI00293EA13B|nr:putative F-box protein At1g49610 [Lycium barbarum]XP_060193449.1 putative F-box protein At1g49610 [Lycium barbarum]